MSRDAQRDRAARAVRPRRHADRQRPRPRRRRQRHARRARPGAAAATSSCARWSAPARAAWSASAFGVAPGDAGYLELRDEFLARYEARMTRETRVFDGMPPRARGARGAQALPWGIVTNKATRFTAPLVAGARPRRARPRRSSAATRRRTPSRIRRRCSRRRGGSAWPPSDCVYVGDDLRDVAGRPRRRHGARSSPPGATWATATRPRPGAPTPSIERPGELLALIGGA